MRSFVIVTLPLLTCGFSTPKFPAFCSNRAHVISNTNLFAEPETTEIFMPALSSTMSEGKIVTWLKSVGDAVSAGEAIMVVESDKADMDVEAFEDGYLAAIIKEEGESAEVGAAVGIIVENEEDIDKVVVGGASPATDSTTTSAPVESGKPDCPFVQIDMPALSSTMKEGKVVSWLKSEGDAIEAGEAIMVVESDKADMDVEAFDEGFLAAIITDEGESATVGAPVALIAEELKDVPTLKAYANTLSGTPTLISTPQPNQSPAKSVSPKPITNPPSNSGDRIIASPLAKKLANEKGIDLATVTGTGPNGRITGGDVEAALSTTPASPAKIQTTPTQPKHTPLAGVIAATPMARVAAKKAKLDLSTITGTGNFGRITETDVKMATGQIQPEAAAPPKRKTGEEVPAMPEGFVAFTGMQKAVSNNMMATLDTPVFRCSKDIQMDKFNALYKSVKSQGVSVSSLLAKACALAIEKHPLINSSMNAEGTGFTYNKDINVAMAVAIDGGLITPTLKYANIQNIFDLGETWRELVGKAKTGTLKPDEYNSGTFTISNLGMMGVSQFDAILPKGQGAILAIGSTQEVVVPDKQSVLGLKVVNKMTVTITCDHRQIYGADGALFLKTLADIMENKVESLLA